MNNIKININRDNALKSFIFLIFIFSTGNFAEKVIPASFSFFNQAIVLVVSVLIFMLVLSGFFKLRYKPNFNFIFYAYATFIIYTVISVAWSKHEIDVYLRVITFSITSFLAFLLAGLVRYDHFLLILFRAQFFLMLIGFILVLIFPTIGIDAADHEGSWKGVFNQKNTFGRSVALCAIVALLLRYTTSNVVKYTYVIYFFCCFILFFSSSRTSLFMTMIFPFFILFFNFIMKNSFSRIKVFTFFICLLFFVAFLLCTDSIFLGNVSSANDYISIFGAEVPLTGRATLWSYVLHSIDYYDMKFFGFGYDGFWGHDFSKMHNWGLGDFVANDSHNGFLDIYLQCGYLGITLFLICIISVFSFIYKSISLTSNSYSLFLIVITFFLVLFNLTESSFLKATNVMQFLFSYMMFSTMYNFNYR